MDVFVGFIVKNQNLLISGQTPLHVAATHGANYASVQLLLTHPYINPNLKNNNGETAWDIARRSSLFYNVFDMADPLISVQNLE